MTTKLENNSIFLILTSKEKARKEKIIKKIAANKVCRKEFLYSDWKTHGIVRI